MRHLFTWHRVAQLLGDAAIVAASWWLAFELRFDHGLPLQYPHLLEKTILIVRYSRIVSTSARLPPTLVS